MAPPCASAYGPCCLCEARVAVEAGVHPKSNLCPACFHTTRAELRRCVEFGAPPRPMCGSSQNAASTSMCKRWEAMEEEIDYRALVLGPSIRRTSSDVTHSVTPSRSSSCGTDSQLLSSSLRRSIEFSSASSHASSEWRSSDFARSPFGGKAFPCLPGEPISEEGRAVFLDQPTVVKMPPPPMRSQSAPALDSEMWIKVSDWLKSNSNLQILVHHLQQGDSGSKGPSLAPTAEEVVL